MEARFDEFVATIGRHVAAGHCHTLQRCNNDPNINPLYEGSERPLHFRADCADVPYFLRAYFAYRNGLPFTFADHMAGRGHDPRYLRNSHPVGLHRWDEYTTPRALLQSVGSIVHSGYMRTAPEIENSDFYQASVDRGGIHPGTVYYDPNGHVLVVYEIHGDGDILLFDGHPDNSLSHPHFSDRYPVGGSSMGGGFKNFRPVFVQNGTVVQKPNSSLADFGGGAPFDRNQFRIAGRSVGYHAWVRHRLTLDSSPATNNAATEPTRASDGRRSEREVPTRAGHGLYDTTRAVPTDTRNARRRNPGA
jgi:hypothetical protein